MTAFLNRFHQLGHVCQQAWTLALPYFRSDQRWTARGLLAAIVGLNLAAVAMLVQLNDWNRLFYDALQNRQVDVFWEQLGRFCYLAAAYIVIAVYKFYLTQLLELRWRTWMTTDLLGRWLAQGAFYRLELQRNSTSNSPPDNPDQRIQEDLNLFTSYTVSLSMGLLNAVVTLLSFVGILWALSGGFALPLPQALGGTADIPGFMVWAALLYCVAGTAITHWIGRPLVGLNFEQQRFEADFRHHLVRVRESSEAIALDRGQGVELAQLRQRFGRVLGNTLQLIRQQKRLTWFTTGFGQAAVVFPFLVAAPRFFSGAIQLGELMQVASAFGRVQDALSWFVDNYDRLAGWRATTDRITRFEASIQLQPLASIDRIATDSGAIEVRQLALGLPDGQPLAELSGFAVQPGERVLIQGPSGCGKSTLFRALAGIWPHGSGVLALPADFARQAMFVPQHPYLPEGSLRAALAYPEPDTTHPDANLREALQAMGLPGLCDRLDESAPWGQRLSGGERQRLALARVLLKQPRWVFADEATSALDEATEHKVYTELLALVQRTGGSLVSIAHRPSVRAFHDRVWVFSAQPRARSSQAGQVPQP